MLIFLYGPDTFRSREYLKQQKKNFIAKYDKSALNLESLDGQKIDIGQFRQSVLAQSFLASKRMIVIENLFKKAQKKLCHEILKTLTETKNDNIIIFWDDEITPTRLPESCRVLYDKLIKEKFSQKFELLKETTLKKWIINKVKSEKGEIDNLAAITLSNWVGNNLWQMNQELDKLLAYCKNNTITVKEVDLLSKSKLEENIFLLTDALGQKNKTQALKLIHDQLDSGTQATMLLSKMIWQFKNLLLIKSLLEEKSSLNYYQVASQLKLHPFVVKKSLQQIKNFSLEELKKIYRQLLGVDFSIKTSQAPAQTLFNLLVAKY